MLPRPLRPRLDIVPVLSTKAPSIKFVAPKVEVVVAEALPPDANSLKNSQETRE